MMTLKTKKKIRKRRKDLNHFGKLIEGKEIITYKQDSQGTTTNKSCRVLKSLELDVNCQGFIQVFWEKDPGQIGKKNCGQNVEIGKNILTKHIKLEAYSTRMNI